MPIQELYLHDQESTDPEYMIRLAPALDNGSIPIGRDKIHLEICTVESTFSRTHYTALGADPKEYSDSKFDYNKCMFTFNLDELIESLQLLKKHGA